MPLPSGTRLGPYEIGSPLGAGGMGEVYRATDTSLGREVAVKVLPDAFAQDPERLARFEREARTLASLNHPNIAAIYGFERGPAEAGHYIGTDVASGFSRTIAIVMELVEGEDLSQAIARLRTSGASAGQAGMPLEEVLPIAKQIAAALEAAHEQGIVHRDLKPANVKVTPDGHVKVLDFGLAKAMGPSDAGSSTGGARADLANSPTITTPAMTQAGMILGTAAYMSPEQAKGRPTDKRSDVWAYGCVLYEMLTGQRAFAGEDVSDTLASILKSDPDWTALPADTPPAIRTLIERCLIKDRRQRIADLSVASFVLAEARALDTPGTTSASAQAESRTSGRRWLAPLAAGIGASALVAFGAWSMRPEPLDRPVARFSVTPAEGQRFATGVRQLVALSPDGQRMAWAGIGRIWVRSVSEFDAHAVAGVETTLAVMAPVFSPDGESLAFYSPDDRTLRRIALSGGASVMICAVGLSPNGMSWDSSGLVFTQPGGIFRCNASGGQPEQLAKIENDEQSHGPQILPGGRALLFTIAKDGDGLERWNKSRIVVQSLVSGERRTLVEGGSDARYLPTGHLVYALEGSVFGVLFDLERLVTTGGAVSVLEGVRRSAAASSGAAHFATSDSGTLVYVPGPARPNPSSVVAVADRAGVVTPLRMPPGRYVHVRASRDGRLLAVDTDDGKEANVSTFELSGVSAMRRLTFGGRNRLPVWSPDGQRIAFQSDRDGAPAIFAQRIDGTGIERLTKPGAGETHVPESWSSDGRHLSFAVQKKGDEFTLWTLSLADGKVTRFRDVLSTEPFGSVFAPDGRWIAYHTLPPGASSTSGNSGVFVEPFPPTGALYQAPRVSRDFHPVWSRDRAELFYVGTTTSGLAAAVPVTTQSGITFGPVATFPFVVTAGRLSASTRGFDVLPNNAFVGVVAESASDRASANPEIRVVLNWFEELKRMVPHP